MINRRDFMIMHIVHFEHMQMIGVIEGLMKPRTL